jgi:peptidoglycan/xylan/chitin deacetylase (PgdA/CDA1 family)
MSREGSGPVSSSPAEGASGPGARRHLLTIVLEDYFHVAPLKSVVENGHWYRFERRVVDNTRKTLNLLDEFNTKATFFVLGWIADEMPELIREVVSRGHEVASKGCATAASTSSTAGFREISLRSRDASSGPREAVHGYRIAHRWFGPRTCGRST